MQNPWAEGTFLPSGLEGCTDDISASSPWAWCPWAFCVGSCYHWMILTVGTRWKRISAEILSLLWELGDLAEQGHVLLAALQPSSMSS